MLGQHQSLSGANVDATIEIARSLFESPNPLPSPTTFRYDTYDTTGAVAEPGSYAFLADPADTTSAVTTYEGLRDGSATALRIHETDADGVSRAAFLDTAEVGDLFEWRQAEDCWVRYRVTGVEAGSDTRDFAIKSYSHTYTGCSGAIGGSGGVDAQSGRSTSGTATTSQFTWAPVTLKTGAFTAPTWHGPSLVIPKNWAGPVPATAVFTGPSISWPPSPLPAPNLGTGWSGSLGRGYPDTELEGIYSHTDGGHLLVYIFQLGRWPIAAYRLSTTYAAPGRIHEFRMIDGRHAVVSYDRVKTVTSQAMVVFYDEATGLVYTVRGGPKSRKNDPEATIDLARKFILPPAGPPPTTFRYDTYDTTGEVAEPGSYAFLEDPANTASAVTTYEGLRDGSATGLRIHETDTDGVSRAAFLDTVEVGDLFEWREAEDCWVRYRVIGVEAGSDTRDFAIKSYSHTYTGCSGAIGGSGSAGAQSGRSASGSATTGQFIWAPVTLKTGAFTAPTWHGPWLVVPKNWAGPVPATAVFTGPSISWPPSPLPAPSLGTGWSGSLGRGYPDTELEGIYSHTDGGHLLVYIFQLGRWPIAAYRLSTTYAAAGVIFEFRMIDGRHAVVSYDRVKTLTSQAMVVFYDEATGLVYTVYGGPKSRKNDPEATIDLARKFLLPPAGPPPTSFRYHTYDTSGEVAEPGSYAFLANPADTGSVVTTYEGLRDGSATGLRIHEADAEGVSRAAFLDTVEVGDLFEWREADDCWVRYRVTGVSAASGDTREFAIKSYSYTYTGCSGAVGGSAAGRQFTWAPEVLKTGAFTVPTMHGPFLIVPQNWTGPVAEIAPFAPPAIPWPPSPLPDPDLGTDWTGGIGPGYPATELEGLYSHSDGGSLSVYIFHLQRWPIAVLRLATSYDQAARINEFRIIDGRPAHVSYSRMKHNGSEARVVIYDEATGVIYNVAVSGGGPKSRRNDPETTIEIARQEIHTGRPTPTSPPPTTFRYHTYDTTGARRRPRQLRLPRRPRRHEERRHHLRGPARRLGDRPAHPRDGRGRRLARRLPRYRRGGRPLRVAAGGRLLRALPRDGATAGPLGDASQAAWRRVDDVRLHGLQRGRSRRVPPPASTLASCPISAGPA